ncbi:hypothetical protein K788_0004923 [Paraburkholderia caribensis MBA4]|uniref:Uncharacterized protein n=1 Tax=Paraburkholderia caribensis MBA4 TaxID=1323664 RepID=A0A0P0R8C6_9BURK|nr:hypothetical protein K788_0004923 [Paraburkholderia caribensis MBA4]
MTARVKQASRGEVERRARFADRRTGACALSAPSSRILARNTLKP